MAVPEAHIRAPIRHLNVAGSFGFRPKFAPIGWPACREVEWDDFVAKSGENPLQFELEGHVNGGGRRTPGSVGGVAAGRGEKGGSRAMTKMPLPFSFVYFWSRLNRLCYR